jgi:hypothetical protein
MTHTPTTLAAAFKDSTPVHGDRTVERNVTLHEHENGSSTVAVLSVRHSKDAKAIGANIRIVRREPPRPGSAFSVTTWIPFEKAHNRRLPSTPVARYSDKALAAADTAVLELLEAEPDWLDTLDLGPHQGDLY